MGGKAGARDPTALDMLRLLLRAEAIRHDRHRAAFMASDDPEQVHQIRVALRRMRALVRGFGDMLAPKTARRLSALLRDEFRRFGPLRDADVQAAMRVGAAGVEAARLRAELRAALAAENAPSLKARIAAILHDTPRAVGSGRRRRLAMAPAGLMASRALHATWTGLLAFGPDPTALPPGDLHDFRKRAKDMRYLAEFLGGRFGGTPGKTEKRLARMQDALGLVNDLHVMRQGASPALPEDHRRREARALAKARKAWAKLRRTGPWWLAIT